MLRTMDEKQGIGVYTQNLMNHLLGLDQRNEYVLFYRTPEFLGRYARYPHVREKVVEAPNKAIWDQVMIPWEARRENVDLIFHTKFTVPFFTSRPTVMVLHGGGWYVTPELYENKLDLAYVRATMPWYCRKASAILSNSDCTTRDFVRIVGVDPAKIRTVRLAADDRFRRIEDRAVLDRTRQKFNLPERFILSVIKYDPRKNWDNLILAFKECRRRIPCKLVVAGLGFDAYRAGQVFEKYRAQTVWSELGLENDVVFLGWVGQDDLPALYNLADFMFFPSTYEEFGIPVCEAMACGCPAVVSKTGALPEIAGDAGTYVDPMNPLEMADALEALWTNDALRKQKAQQGLARSREFSWERCARETLALLESVGNQATE